MSLHKNSSELVLRVVRGGENGARLQKKAARRDDPVRARRSAGEAVYFLALDFFAAFASAFAASFSFFAACT